MSKLFAPAATRNQQPILGVLQRVLPASGCVLEIASGSGQHAAYMARHLPQLRWQPTDLDRDARDSIEAYRAEEGTQNLLAPLALDAASDDWPAGEYSAIVCINMIHIAPWEACLGMLRGAARVLDVGAPLVLYGPMILPDQPTAPSNLEFDRSLRQRNASWGVRKLEDIQRAAKPHGFALEEVVPCPANNHVIVFRLTSD